VPKEFVAIKALPKNSSGKVLKPLLKAQAQMRVQEVPGPCA